MSSVRLAGVRTRLPAQPVEDEVENLREPFAEATRLGISQPLDEEAVSHADDRDGDRFGVVTAEVLGRGVLFDELGEKLDSPAEPRGPAGRSGVVRIEKEHRVRLEPLLGEVDLAP